MNKQHLYFIGGIVGGSILLILLTKYLSNKFDLSLFDSPDKLGSGKLMDKQFLAMLKKAEKYAGFKFSYNSAFRTKSHNKIVGGVADSSHTKGLAVDIKASSIKQRDAIVAAARKAGFKRIGIASTFVHLDNDTTKPLYVAWGYPKGANAPYNPFAKSRNAA
jgi:hypothetical protein